MATKSAPTSTPTLSPAEQQKRQRIIYLRVRIPELRAELSKLNAERKSLQSERAKESSKD